VYSGGNPISWIDPTGLTGLWLEGSSGREPGPHQSVGFGELNKENITLSFGVKAGESPFGGVGEVYIDTETGGKIFEYYDVPPKLENLILTELMGQYGKEGKYNLGSNNCRHWSNIIIDRLIAKYNLKKIKAPYRLPKPAGTLPMSSSKPTTYGGVWSSSPGPTTNSWR